MPADFKTIHIRIIGLFWEYGVMFAGNSDCDTDTKMAAYQKSFTSSSCLQLMTFFSCMTGRESSQPDEDEVHPVKKVMRKIFYRNTLHLHLELNRRRKGKDAHCAKNRSFWRSANERPPPARSASTHAITSKVESWPGAVTQLYCLLEIWVSLLGKIQFKLKR